MRRGARNGRVWLAALALVCAGSATMQAQAIIAPAGRTLFSGATLLRAFVDATDLSFGSGQGDRQITRYITPLALVYGIRPQWSLIVAQPYVTLDVDSVGSSPGQGSGGLGNLQFLAQYDGLYSRNSPGGLTRLSGVFGLRVPSGAERFSTDSVAYLAGLIFEKQVRLKYVFTADVEYTLETTSSAGLEVGDRLRFDAVPGYFLISRGSAATASGWLEHLYQRLFRHGAYLLLEFNGSWQGRSSKKGRELAASGGTLLWLSPGIQYFASDSLLLEFSSPIPVVRSLHGKQPKPDSRYVFGLRYLF